MARRLCIFFIFLLFSFVASTPFQNYLPRGSSLSVKNADSDLLMSPDKTFTAGFYSFGFNAYWFAIWFTNSKDRTVVWMANRDNPVNGHGSKFTLRKDGVLVLSDLHGSRTWETDTSATNADRVELLESGNLVLMDTAGKILWQSFDFPTDTLLPGQTFTKTQQLVSRLSPGMSSSGYFSFFFDNDNVLRLMYDGPQLSSIYWPNPDHSVQLNGRIDNNISRTAILSDFGYFSSSDLLQFNASDIGLGVKRRLTIDYDGNLRLYSLIESSGSWVITWQAIQKQCDVHGLCGMYGICVYTPEPRCSCPPYFEPASLSDWSKGCKPKFTRGCSDSHYVEVPHVNYYGIDIIFTENVSFADCQEFCTKDCRCQGFKYIASGRRSCYTKSALFNGRNASDTSLYLRVPMKEAQKLEPVNVSNLECGREEQKLVREPNVYYGALIYLYSFAGGIGAIEAVLIATWFFSRRRGISASLEDGYRAISSQFRSFSYSELKKATGNFKQVLGRGGFGAVYKGILVDEREVAVKKLEGVVQGEEEFWAEVSTFGRINHMNLVRMWGFCSEGKHRLLVYEYVENGSLDKHLFSSSTTVPLLGWEERFRIALGIARGLAYLHHECLEWVIHCDVKPENILLDRDFEPKISDFGLAKLCQRGDYGLAELSRIRGTKGYMAPEWTTNLPLTAKVDVYSYGTVILELVRGIRLSSLSTDDLQQGTEMQYMTNFVKMARGNMQDGGDLWMVELVDPKLGGNFNRNQAAKMIGLGLLCVEDDRAKRPTMEAVAQALEGCEAD